MTSKKDRIAVLRRLQSMPIASMPISGGSVASDDDLENVIKAIEAEEDTEEDKDE